MVNEWFQTTFNATTVTDTDAIDSQNNNDDRNRFIRMVNYAGAMSAQPSESAQKSQISLRRIIREADEGVTRDKTLTVYMAGGAAGATTTDAEQSAFVNKSWAFPRGAFPWRTGETLAHHVNRLFGTGGSANFEWEIFWEYE